MPRFHIHAFDWKNSGRGFPKSKKAACLRLSYRGFTGSLCKFYYGDHLPARFHVEFAGAVAKIDIETLSVISGSLPVRARGLVIEWASIHQEELREAF